MTDSENSENKNADGTSGEATSGPEDATPPPSEPGGRTDDEPTPAYPSDTGDPTAKLGSAAPTDQSPRAYSQMSRADTAKFEDPGQTSSFGPNDGFTPVPPTAQGGVVATSPARRNTGKIIAAVSAAVVLVLVIAAVGSELYLRNKATDCMQSAFTELTGTETNVSLSRKPMLLQGFGNDIPFVQVDTVDQPGQMRLHARAENIKGDGDKSTIQSLVGTGFIPFDRVVAMSKSATASGGGTSSGTQNGQSGASGLMQGASIEAVSGNAADGTIKVDSSVQLAFLPIPVSTTIKPILQDGRVRFEVVEANAFIFGIPADFAQQVVDSVTGSMFGKLFDEVTVKSLKVTDQGVDFAVDGQDVALDGQVAGGSGDCSAA
ncbi:LmeA family phospholipid-binding protein [Gordonia insulae]|uniref:DUF2993 domain-containing protein n=1 Tax=Gordonia insulae TaxID=2420509 RepID=A0A3G8JNS4_9ACTN|nr:LmeA family phospholipid-binding protein [Gordonia insulae]AZG46109.1 hypothetical protein D7316_02710 [Gordonia insulae]